MVSVHSTFGTSAVLVDEVRVHEDVGRICLFQLWTYRDVNVRLRRCFEVDVASTSAYANGVIYFFHRILDSRGLVAHLCRANVVRVRVLCRRPNASAIVHRFASLFRGLRHMIVRRRANLMLEVYNAVRGATSPRITMHVILCFGRSIIRRLYLRVNLWVDPRDCFHPVREKLLCRKGDAIKAFNDSDRRRIDLVNNVARGVAFGRDRNAFRFAYGRVVMNVNCYVWLFFVDIFQPNEIGRCVGL